MAKLKNLADAIKKANASSADSSGKKDHTPPTPDIRTQRTGGRTSFGGPKVQRAQGRGR